MLTKVASANIWELPASQIRTSPYQPRKHFDTGSIAELAESISRYGVLQPIIVRRSRGSSTYELVTGERRLRAVRLLGMKTVPAVVVQGNDDDCAAMALIENLQRRELGFFEEAQAYNQLISEHGLSEGRVAQMTGRREATIQNKLRLLRLSESLRKEIFDKKLSEEHAAALLQFPDEGERLRALSKMAEEDKEKRDAGIYAQKIEKRLEEPKHLLPDIQGDNRIFVNTIDKAVDLIRDAGATTGTQRREYDDRIEYLITIIKR